MFGDKDATEIVRLRSYDDYYYGYDDNKGKHIKGYEERIAELIQKYPLDKQIIGEQNKKQFVILYGNILRLQNILSSFDKFEGEEILLTSDFQNYTGIYLDIRDEFKHKGDKESIVEDVVFEMELVKQLEVNIDYILIEINNNREKKKSPKSTV